MKHKMLTLVFALCSLTVFASSTGEQLARADVLYNTSQYDSAAAIYHKVLEPDNVSPTVFYNLGNCYYKLGDYPRAALYYEKALKYAPGDEDARANLKLVRSYFKDKVNTDRTGLSGWFYETVQTKVPGYWAWGSVLLVNFAFISFILIQLGVAPSLRRMMLVSGLGALLLGAGSFMLAAYRKNAVSQATQAIVFEPSVDIKSAPSDNSQTVFVLHEGTKVNLRGENEEWYEIAIDAANVGWVKKEYLGLI